MGISGLLPRILPSAGRENYDLRSLSDGLIVLTSSSSHNDNDNDNDNDNRCPQWRRRKFRLAIDIDGWVARASHGHGAFLMDERHLSYHGRAQLTREALKQQPHDQQNQQQQQQQNAEYSSRCIQFLLARIDYLQYQCNTDILPVLDGATPPAKKRVVAGRWEKKRKAVEERDAPTVAPTALDKRQKENLQQQGEDAAITELEAMRRISASKRAGAGVDPVLRQTMINQLLIEFRTRKLPFIVAPYEADGQLAYLAEAGWVDLVITEDSDLIARGVNTLVYRLGGWNGGNAANRNEAGRQHHYLSSMGGGLRGTILHRKDLGSSRGIDLLDFSDAMLAVMFVAAGCDYCESLRGIGVVTARDIVARSFLYPTYPRKPPLMAVLQELFHLCRGDDYKKLHTELKSEMARATYEQLFLEAVAMYRHPLIYDPIKGINIIANDVSIDAKGMINKENGNNRYHVKLSFLREEETLMEYEPYRNLVTNREALYEVVGRPYPPDVARQIARGLIDPRIWIDNQRRNCEESATEAYQEEKEKVDANHTLQESTIEGSQLQIYSQDLNTGTQQSKSTSSATTGGNVSSLSPDLLASP